MSRCRILLGLSFLLLTATAGFAATPVCTTGELFAGAPDFQDPKQRASQGQGLLDVPPLGWRSLLFVGDKLVTATGPELWYADLASPEPTLKRLAGRERGSARSSEPGKCADARFTSISGIALLSDGSIVGADYPANNIFVVTDPFGPQCSVSLIAGATKPQVPLNVGQPANVGDADGPGASALLRGPDWIAAADDGTVYFLDSGNSKLKKVLPDPAYSVETVAKLPEGVYYALIASNGNLYTIANNENSEGFLLEIDPGSGSVREVVSGRSDLWLSYSSINVSGLATDGTGFFTTQSGQLLYVTLDGDITSIAGNGTFIELQPGYDPREPHPASELQLWATRRTQTAGANVFLAYRDGYIYYSAAGLTPYVERIACK